MFNSKKNHISEEVTSTIIGEGLTITNADITGSGTIRVDGTLIGKINIESNLILGETGRITGDVTARNVLVAGELHGNVNASVSVHLASSGRLTGNLDTATLIIDEGARFNGECRMEKGNETA